MTEIIKGAEGRRTHMRSGLMRESLMDKTVMAASDKQAVVAILPDVNIVSIGGCSIMDRGKNAIVPLLDEVVRCRREHQIVLGVGLGARLRHTYHICLDLGIPTGGMAMVAGAVGSRTGTWCKLSSPSTAASSCTKTTSWCSRSGLRPD